RAVLHVLAAERADEHAHAAAEGDYALQELDRAAVEHAAALTGARRALAEAAGRAAPAATEATGDRRMVVELPEPQVQNGWTATWATRRAPSGQGVVWADRTAPAYESDPAWHVEVGRAHLAAARWLDERATPGGAS
ncbi:MAG TPA: hypothetical protein VGD67_26880, partial [Pseudonocardiaceae bacterium]